MGAFHTYQSDFYEVVPCKFCWDDARRVVCSSESCDHAFCSRERGVCFDCAREKLGDYSPQIQHTLHGHYELAIAGDEESGGLDNAIRAIEDGG